MEAHPRPEPASSTRSDWHAEVLPAVQGPRWAPRPGTAPLRLDPVPATAVSEAAAPGTVADHHVRAQVELEVYEVAPNYRRLFLHTGRAPANADPANDPRTYTPAIKLVLDADVHGSGSPDTQSADERKRSTVGPAPRSSESGSVETPVRTTMVLTVGCLDDLLTPGRHAKYSVIIAISCLM